MFIVKGDGVSLRSAYEATIAICDVRDKSFQAKKDYPAIAVQHGIVGGDTKHYAFLPVVYGFGSTHWDTRLDRFIDTPRIQWMNS